jgi:hypothetical protein
LSASASLQNEKKQILRFGVARLKRLWKNSDVGLVMKATGFSPYVKASHNEHGFSP